MMKKYFSMAKTSRPALSSVFHRERLFELLDRGLRYPLTWISGPPGSGKTTVVASYLASKFTNPFFGKRQLMHNHHNYTDGKIYEENMIYQDRAGSFERS